MTLRGINISIGTGVIGIGIQILNWKCHQSEQFLMRISPTEQFPGRVIPLPDSSSTRHFSWLDAFLTDHLDSLPNGQLIKWYFPKQLVPRSANFLTKQLPNQAFPWLNVFLTDHLPDYTVPRLNKNLKVNF